MKWLWRRVVAKILAEEIGQRWFTMFYTMEGGVVVSLGCSEFTVPWSAFSIPFKQGMFGDLKM